MADDIDIKFTGLNTSANPFSAGEGACEIADNVVLRDPNLIEPRRGYFTSTNACPGGTIQRFLQPFQNTLPTIAADGGLRLYTQGASGTYSASYGTYSAPDSANPIRSAVSAKDLFWTSSTGVQMLDTPADAAQQAGIGTPPLVTFGFYPSSGSYSTWFANNTTVSYRAVLCAYDVNGRLIQSAPSSKFTLTNTSGATQAVVPAVYISQDTTATFCQIYRSVSVASGSTPSDEMFLVGEGTFKTDVHWPTGALAYVTIDSSPDSYLIGSPPLYTNQITGDGAQAANNQPPLARELCAFGDYLLYANTQERHEVDLQLIGLAAAQVGDVLTVNGIAFTAVNTTPDFLNSPFARQWQLFTAGTAAQNIQNTAYSIAQAVVAYNGAAINVTHPTTGVDVFYTSGSSDSPGMLAFVEHGIGGNGFSISYTGGRANTFVPEISGTSVASSNNRQPSRLWWSQQNIPDGVGPFNWMQVGAWDKDILRCILVKSTVFIFKKDGLFTLSGNDPSTWALTPFDPSLILLAPESCAVVNNQIFCWTNRGAVYVSESGVSPAISEVIERDLSFAQAASPQYATSAFGVGSEPDGYYLLAFPAASNETGCSHQYIFNEDNPSWTRWTLPNVTHGLLSPWTNTLCWASGAYVWEERKTFTSADFQDPTQTATPTTVVGTTLTFASANHGVSFGDVLYRGALWARVTAVNGATVTTDAAPGFTGSVQLSVAKAINSTVKLLPIVAGDPINQKRFSRVYASFKRLELEQLVAGFDTDLANTTSSAIITPPDSFAWGSFPWGQVPWGGLSKNQLVSIGIPQNASQATVLGITLTMQQALCFWQLQGLKVKFEPGAGLPRR